jgi:hypothetical protein
MEHTEITDARRARRPARLPVVAAIVIAVVLIASQGGTVAGAGQDPPFPFPVTVFDCEEDPGTIGQAEVPEGCVGAEGVAIAVADGEANELGACVTGEGGMCIIDINVPDDGVVVVEEKVSTISAGYTPRENPVEVQVVNEFSEAKIVNLRDADSLPETGSGGSQSLAPWSWDLVGPLLIVAVLLAILGLIFRRGGH